MDIWILSDGKQGHLNQSIGLAQALLKEVGGRYQIIDLSDKSFFQKIQIIHSAAKTPHPDIIIAAGHSTHIPLIIASFLTKSISILCMKPSLPCSLFDLCVIPRHDLIHHSPMAHSHIFSTVGALHPIQPSPSTPKDHTLVLIGGPSKEFLWTNDTVLSQLKSIWDNTEGEIILTTSRRTPDDFTEKLRREIPEITIVPVEETQPGWVAEHLTRAKGIWVSMDSVSMVYEALGSGAPVGIIEVPKKTPKSSRVFRGLQMLIEEDRVTLFDHWVRQNYHLAPQQTPLLETKRAADYILSHFFPQLTKAH